MSRQIGPLNSARSRSLPDGRISGLGWPDVRKSGAAEFAAEFADFHAVACYRNCRFL